MKEPEFAPEPEQEPPEEQPHVSRQRRRSGSISGTFALILAGMALISGIDLASGNFDATRNIALQLFGAGLGAWKSRNDN